MAGDTDTVLGRLVVERGHVSSEDLAQALVEQRMSGGRGLADVLVSKGLISRDTAEELARDIDAGQGEGGPSDAGPTGAADAGGAEGTVGGCEIVSKLTDGAAGEVFKVRCPDSAEFVGLELLPARFASDSLVARALREIDAARALDYAGIAKMLDFGRDAATDSCYWTLGLAEGETVLARIERLGPLAEGEVIGIGRHMSSALRHAREGGLVQRAAVPANICLTPEGVVKLLNVGLALDVEADTDEPAPFVVAMRRYAAPEVARGEPGDDIRSDVYALGASMYHMATGRAPFGEAPATDVLARQIDGRVPWPGDVNAAISNGLSVVISKMMAKDQADRYATLTELSLDLDIVRQGLAPVIAADAPPVSTVAPADGLAAGGPARVATPAGAEPEPVDRDLARPRVARASAEGEGEAAGGAEGSKLLYVGLAVGGAFAAIGLGILVFLLTRGEARRPAGRSRTPASGAVPASALPAAGPATDPIGPDLVATSVEPPPSVAGSDTPLGERPAAPAVAADAELVTAPADDDPRCEQAGKRAAAALVAARAKIGRLVSKGDYDGALAALASVDVEGVPDAAAEVAKASRGLADAAALWISEALSKAERLAADGDARGAREALAALEGLRFARGLEDVSARRQSVLGKVAVIEGVSARAAEKSARARLPEFLAAFDAALAKDDLSGARERMLALAAQKKFAGVAETLRGAARVAGALEARRGAMLAAARAMVGKPVSVRTETTLRRGTLEAAGADGLTVLSRVVINGRVTGEKRHVIRWTELPSAEVDRFASLWAPEGPDGALARALVALGRGDVAGAEERLGEAGDHPLAAHVRAKLEAARKETIEDEAAEAWLAIERRASVRRMSAAAARSLLKRIDDFEKTYGKTKRAAGLAEKIAAARARAESVVDPTMKAVLLPSDDTYLDPQRQRDCFGKTPEFRGTGGSPILIRFGTAAIPATARVLKATLSLHVQGRRRTGDADAKVLVHAILPANAGWREGTSDAGRARAGDSAWAFKAPGTPWAGALGMAHSGVDFDAEALATLAVPATAAGRIKVEIDPEVVQGWVAEPETNHGIVLRTTAQPSLRFASKEDTSPARRPWLALEMKSVGKE